VKGIKIGMAIVLLATVGVITWRHRLRPEPIPNEEVIQTTWMCSDNECKHVFTLTSKEIEAARSAEPQPWPPAFCSKCKERTAYQTLKCEKCGTLYFSQEVKGSSGACPKCFPDTKPPEEYYPAEEGQEAPRPRPKVL